MKEVFIVAAKRTPIGGFMGNFIITSLLSQLGATAIRGTYESIQFASCN
jgi:acetyl-CoA C-acetyltransferase